MACARGAVGPTRPCSRSSSRQAAPLPQPGRRAATLLFSGRASEGRHALSTTNGFLTVILWFLGFREQNDVGALGFELWPCCSCMRGRF